MRKAYQICEDRHPGKMMLLHGINYIIIVYHLPTLILYNDEAKNESFTKGFIFGLEPNQKN